MSRQSHLDVVVAESLSPLIGFARNLRTLSWFAAVGEPLAESEIEDCRAYLDGLGLKYATVAATRTWRDAEAVTRSPDWNPLWWSAEEEARRTLISRANAKHGESSVLVALTEVMHEVSAIVLGAASAALSREGVADPALARVVAGAASQAADQAGLALAAAAGETHPFAIKFRLFAAGRWPLGLIGRTFHLF
jgi:hypothetical protein